MKIAVCDDDESDLQLMLSYCRQYAPNTQTVAFRDGETLLAAFKSDFFDLVFLNIEMGHPDGLEVGSLLVNASHKPVIVFTTHSLNYAVRGYGIALRYLHKPISYDTFSDVMKLDNAIEACSQIDDKKERIVSVWLYQKNHLLLYEISNPYNEKSSKKAGKIHGYGLKNVSACVEKNDGIINIEKSHSIFDVSIQLNLND